MKEVNKMKCIKIDNEIFSLENVKKVSIGTGSVVHIDYFNKDYTSIKCNKKENAEKVLNQIFEILLEKA
jgi:predicted nucleic-acid-binding Zn-ribbon protein